MSTQAQYDRAAEIDRRRSHEALALIKKAAETLDEATSLPATEAHERLEFTGYELRAGLEQKPRDPSPPASSKGPIGAPPLSRSHHRRIKSAFAERRTKENDRRQRAKKGKP